MNSTFQKTVRQLIKLAKDTKDECARESLNRLFAHFGNLDYTMRFDEVLEICDIAEDFVNEPSEQDTANVKQAVALARDYVNRIVDGRQLRTAIDELFIEDLAFVHDDDGDEHYEAPATEGNAIKLGKAGMAWRVNENDEVVYTGSYWDLNGNLATAVITLVDYE